MPSELKTRLIKGQVRLTLGDHLNMSGSKQLHTKPVYNKVK